MIKVGIVSLRRTWISFYVLYLILSSHSVYMYLFPIGTILQVGTLAISAVTMLFFIRKRINQEVFLLPHVMTALFTLESFFSTTDSVATIMAFVRFTLIFYCVAMLYRRNVDLLNVIYRCLFFLMTFYFLCYLIFDLLAPGWGLSYIKIYMKNVEGIKTYALYENHFNFYFRWATSVRFLGIEIKRLCGFGSEPGQYQLYLNFVLMYLLLFDKNPKLKQCQIIFTTLNVALCGSSMGYIIAVILFVIRLSLQKRKAFRFLRFISITVFGALSVRSILQTKMVESEYSFSNRTSELNLILDVLFHNNPLGTQCTNATNSNGLIRFLWAYGYLAVAAATYILVSIWKNKGQMKLVRQKIAFSVWLMLSLFNEPIEFFNFTFLIVALIMVDSIESKKKTAQVMNEGFA